MLMLKNIYILNLNIEEDNMKKVNLKIGFIILMSLIVLVVLSITANAATGDLEIIKSGDDYIFYVEGYELSKFQFAFSKDSETSMDTLKLTPNWTDSNNVNVACLDNEMAQELGIDLTDDVQDEIFMWVKAEDDKFVVGSETAGKEIDLSAALVKEAMYDLENLTKLISVDLNQSTTTEEEVDGVKISRTTGKVVITDSAEFTYNYSLVKVDESVEIAEFLKLLDEMKATYSEKSMSEKIKEIRKLDAAFTNVLLKANWTPVENMTINQPEESVQGDRYIVLLQKVEDGTVVATDAQILECFENEEEVKETEKVPVKVTTKLPVTGEDITLYVILGVIVVIIIAIIIRMAVLKTKGKDGNK